MDVIFHLTIPLIIVSLAGANKKQAVALLPLAILPDIGRFFYLTRALHSFIFILAVLAVVFLLNYFVRKDKNRKSLMAISAFYLFSHLLLDLGSPMALFFPLSDITYTLKIGLILVNLVPTPVLSLELGRLSDLVQGQGRVITEPGLGILLMVFAFLLYLKISKKRFFDD